MRITSDGASNIQSVYMSAMSPISGTQSSEKARGAEGSFDQVNISQNLSSETQFQKELTARVVRDIRSTTSTGAIQQVREQLQAGTYRPDPNKIAAAIMLEG
ncbi:MAG: flagellar biosynthesis anti-sigma factor FlgM [Intestinimonas sp.]|nr:flagellar biosynthesis anti-sigma factor FlgM [Intestinimonas sp.]